MNFLFVSVLLVISCDLSSAQYAVDGKCPEKCIPKVGNLTIDHFTGVWYDQLGLPFLWQQEYKCNFLNFSEVDSKTTFLEVFETKKELLTPRKTSGLIEFTPDGFLNFTYSKLTLQFDFQFLKITPDFFVATTCTECGYFSNKGIGLYAYIYTRQRVPDCDVMEDAKAVLTECGVPADILIPHDQTNCVLC